MRAVIWMVALQLASCPKAMAFKNIEADAVYDGPIKEQILKEFTQGLVMLKSQADGLGMEVREKDVIALRQHMYDKAILMGACVDKAITFKKMISDKILLDKYVSGCIQTHIKFIASLDGAKWTRSMQMCSLSARTGTDINRPYDFLIKKDANNNPSIYSMLELQQTDYVKMKDCFDNRSAKDKMLDAAF
jgi:hypothetical protein